MVKAAEVEIFGSRRPKTSRYANQDFSDKNDDYDSDILNDSLADSSKEEEEEPGTSITHLNDNLEDSICSSPLPFRIRTADEFMSILSKKRDPVDLSCSSSFDESDAEQHEEQKHNYEGKSRFEAHANAKKEARPSPSAYSFRSKPSNNIALSPPKQRNTRSESSDLSGATTTATSTRKVTKRTVVTTAATSAGKATERTTSVQAERGPVKYDSVPSGRPPKMWNISAPNNSSKCKNKVKNKVKSRTGQRSNGTARVYDRCVPPRMNAPTVKIDTPPSKEGVRVIWTSTAPNNGPPPSHYELQQRRSSDGIWKTVSAELTDTHCVIANAIPGERYSFRVRARNRYGWARRWSALSKAAVLARDSTADGAMTEPLFARAKQDRALAIQQQAELLRRNRRTNASDSPFFAGTPRSAAASEPSETRRSPHHDRRVLRPSHTSPTRTSARAPPPGTLSMQARRLEQSLAKLDARLADNRWHRNR